MFRRYLFIMIAILGILLQFSTAPATGSQKRARLSPSRTIVFMSDFGVVDDSVAICKGVMLGIEPELRIVDLTHEVTPYSILDGARFLAGTTPYYGPGTVFVVVIDPGVGSTRKPIVAKTKRGHYFVLPDNGLLTLVMQQDELPTLHG
jgi:S-adenosyl-L-methionine hydrolase (adenosine-forming)